MKFKKLKLIVAILSITLFVFGYGFFIHSPYIGERLKEVASFYFHILLPHKHLKIVKVPLLRKSIVDENNNTLEKAIRIYKLSLANGILNKNEFSSLINQLFKIISVNKHIKYYYRNDEYKNTTQLPFKIISYNINKANISKVEAILQHSYHLRKNSYRFDVSGEKILYPYKDMFTPYIGYTRKRLKKNYTYRQGRNGLQGYYDKNLSAIADKQNKKDLMVNISIDLQKNLENELDILKAKQHIQEAMAIIINPQNYHIKAIASSNRYDANKIYKKDKQNLEIHAILYLFKIGNFINPIKDYKAFGLYEKSGIDLLYERTYNNKALNNDIKCFKINFIQLVKMYAVFYNGGKIGKPTIVKTHIPFALKQIISKKDADTVKVMLPHFFDKIKNKKFIIEKQDSNETAHIYMKEINFNGKNYLKAYFMIDKKKDD